MGQSAPTLVGALPVNGGEGEERLVFGLGGIF